MADLSQKNRYQEDHLEPEIEKCDKSLPTIMSHKSYVADAVVDLVMSELLDELHGEFFWQTIASKTRSIHLSKQFMAFKGHFGHIQTESSEAETVYGIRTNFNAVQEYSNLLVKFIYENFSD